ncbi:MAG: ABC transporter substrate-binding protein, partial [Bosea sp.]|nr:ABC transporter substrate-binding protein [Bosea sp. (in: a-proteobacteria)]
QLLFIQQRDRNIRRVGVLSAGWPERSDVAVATRKGAGLAQAITLALEGTYRDGTFDAALRRWGVEEERLEKPETNPRGLPKY